MKKLTLAFAFTLASFFAIAQGQLQVNSNDDGLYINHTVAPKENFYSIGRLYNISPRDIAAFNNVDMANGLAIGQTLMVPLNATNFNQSTASGTPVYYVVGDKEGLYRVSVKHNKVLMADLRKWNKLQNDAISAGTKLIVGYLVSSEMASAGVPARTETATVPVKETPPQPKAEPQPKPEPQMQVQAEPKPKPQVQMVTNVEGDGFFKRDFAAQIKEHPITKDETVTSGIFKTASGWEDGKYYALIDGVDPGTIIKVVNPSNGKTIYAKVLGQMSGIRQNQGFDVRISNAAAITLGVLDTEKFIVKVNY